MIFYPFSLSKYLIALSVISRSAGVELSAPEQEQLALAVSYGVPDARWAREVAILWRHETRFRPKIGDKGLARCYGQIHPSRLIPNSSIFEELEEPEKSEIRYNWEDLEDPSTCANATFRILRYSLAACDGDRAGMFSFYGTGYTCGVRELRERSHG